MDKPIGTELTEAEAYTIRMSPQYIYERQTNIAFFKGIQISGPCGNCGYMIGSRPGYNYVAYDFGCKKCKTGR